MQILIAAIYLVILYLAGDTSTVLRIPFIGSLDLGLFYYPVALFILIVGTVNAVNLTDGIDGLAGSVTFVAALGFMIIAALLSIYEMQLLAVAVAGAIAGLSGLGIFTGKGVHGRYRLYVFRRAGDCHGFWSGTAFFDCHDRNYLPDRDPFGHAAGRFF